MATVKKKQNRLMSEINVVPYIDVMLVLLVIFMITAPLLSQGVKVNLPRAAARPLSTKDQEPVIISVDAKGNYYLNLASNPDQPIDENVLVSRITAELQIAKNHNQQRQVLVKGDRDVNYGKIVQVMVLLQHAGVSNVGLMTQENKSQRN
jgi:biopolymer transport protein TolR